VLIRGRARAPLTKTLLLLGIAALFAVPTVITLNLKHIGEDAVEAEGHLQSMMTEVEIQDGIEYRVISGRMTAQDAQTQLSAARFRAQGHLRQSSDLGLNPAALADINEMTSLYAGELDEEVRLLSLGETALALHFDKTQLDPTFERVQTVLQGQAAYLETEAKKAQRLGDAGVLLTVLLSLVLVSVVQSRRKRSEVRSEAKKQSEARYRTLINQSSDLVLVVDRSGRTSFASPSAERMLCSQTRDHKTMRRSAAGAGVVDFVAAVDPVDRERLSMVLRTALPGSRSIDEYRVNGRHGSASFELTVQDLTADPSVGGLVLTGHDVTERLALHHEMRHRALHDALTGLPNRALLFDRFEQTLLTAEREGTSAGLLLLDLERFKEVNDTYGHHYGDELLRQIGPRLADVLREVDTLARLGGDEFAVLLPDVGGVEDATTVAAALLAALTWPFLVEGVALDVEASIGVVVSGEHGKDVITLLQHADIAMYVAKSQHLGAFAYDPAIDQHSASRLAMVGDLRRALERNELVLYYQPKVRISDGHLLGVEALARWEHPQNGHLLPDEFIPIAERTGLIGPLTRHLIDAALAQARIWIDCGRPLPIAVNLSARSLHDPHLAELVAYLLAVHEVPAELFELEVTESAIMIDSERARQTLEQLSALGVRLSIDDFGAGYTSLSQLTSLPISEIKIDRSFVMTMTQDRKDSLIVQSIISLGHNLGMTLVAEGVENGTILSALSDYGCDVAQGFHMCEAVSVDDFESWSMTIQ